MGALLLATQPIDEVRQLLEIEDFFAPSHRLVYAAVLECRDLGEKPDPVTVGDLLARQGNLAKVGGQGGLLALQASAPAISNAARYAALVRERADLRNLAEVGRYITGLAETEGNLMDLQERAEEAVYNLRRRATGGSRLKTAREVVDAALAHLEVIESGGKAVAGTPSGLAVLDRVTKGFQPKTLTIIAGRPGQGKSALALTFAHHCAVHDGRPVIYRSAEVGEIETGLRMLSFESRVNGSNLKTAALTGPEWEKVTASAHKLSGVPFYLDFGPLNVAAITSQAKLGKAREGDLSMVIVDQLQCFPSTPDRRTKADYFGDLARQHKVMANELDVPVVLLAQLRRDGGSGRRPSQDDLKDSGGIEENADLVVGIWRENPENYEAKLIIMKHRSGETGEVDVAFLGKYTRFADMSKAG